MIFQAVLFVLAASESLATPSQSFLHHVELPGVADSNKTEPVSEGEPSSTGTSRIAERDVGQDVKDDATPGSPASSPSPSAAESIPKVDPLDTVVASIRQFRSIPGTEQAASSQASSTATADIDASSNSSNSDSLSKVRMLRSILEQADMSVDAEVQSTNPPKCQCPSGECFGDVCRLMDLTSIPSDAGALDSSSSVPTTGNRVTVAASNNSNSSVSDATVTSSTAAISDNAAALDSSSSILTPGNRVKRHLAEQSEINATATSIHCCIKLQQFFSQ
uniref:Uncharacterized protein n=1 Tax=Lygus hesperus TaxID=30085 RepID=A0A0K8SVB4_LYGHE